MWRDCGRASIIRGLRIICGIRVETSGLEGWPATGTADRVAPPVGVRHCRLADAGAALLLRAEAGAAADPVVRPVDAAYRHDRGGSRRRCFGVARIGARSRASGSRGTPDRDLSRGHAGGSPVQCCPCSPAWRRWRRGPACRCIPVVTDSGDCWGRRAFRKRPGTIHIRVLAPIPAGTGRAELMERLATALLADPSPSSTWRPPCCGKLCGLTCLPALKAPQSAFVSH